MSSDPFGTTGENAAVTAGQVDPMFADILDTQPAERNVGYEPLPAFGDYVFEIVDAKGEKYEKSGNTGVAVQLLITHGPGETAGQKTGWLRPLFFKTKRTDSKGQARTEEAYNKARRANFADIQRLNVAAGNPEKTLPSNVDDQAALDAYAATIKGKKMIGRLEIEVDQQRRAQNKLILGSVEAIGAPGQKKEKGKWVKVPGKTALDLALEAIEAENKRLATASGTSGQRQDKGPF